MPTSGFCALADLRVKIKEGERRDMYLDLAKELKKLWNMKMMLIPIIIGVLGTIPKGAARVGNRSTSRYHPEYSTVKVGQNTEKSPGSLRSTYKCLGLQ